MKRNKIRSELQNCSNIDKMPTVKPQWKWHKSVIKTVLARETKHDGHIPVRKSQRKSMGNKNVMKDIYSVDRVEDEKEPLKSN